MIINIGSTANDGNGDPLRTAGDKLNTLHAVKSRTDDAGAITAAEGDLYIVPASATGAFSGQDDDLAWYDGSSWEFYTPTEGFFVWVSDDDELVYFDGTDWTAFSAGSATFLSLTDTPSSFSGQGLKGVRVNSGATALEFYDTSGVSLDGYYASEVTTSLGSTLDTSTSGYASKGNLIQVQNPIRVNGLEVDMEAASSGDNCEAFVAIMSDATASGTISSITKKAFVSSGAGTQTVTFDSPIQLVENDIIIFGVTNNDVTASSDPYVRFYTTDTYSETIFLEKLGNLGARFTDNDLAVSDSPFDLTSNWWAVNLIYQPVNALVPSGGTAGQVLSKVNGTDFNTQWLDAVPMIQSEETASHVASNDDFAGNRVIRLTNASAMNFTVNSGLTNKQPLTLIQTGAGQVTVVAGASVTIHSAGGALKLSGQYSAGTLIPDADTADTYYLVGDIST